MGSADRVDSTEVASPGGRMKYVKVDSVSCHLSYFNIFYMKNKVGRDSSLNASTTLGLGLLFFRLSGVHDYTRKISRPSTKSYLINMGQPAEPIAA